MDGDQSSASKLITAIKRLRPAEESSGSALEQALRDVRAASANGQAMDLIGSVVLASVPSSPLERFASSYKGSLVRPGPFAITREPASVDITERVLVDVRGLPDQCNNPLAPDWVHGMRPSRSSGPFVDERGQRFWIDTYVLQHAIDIECEMPLGARRSLAQLPLAHVASAAATAPLRSGSVWLAAQALDPGRTSNEFVGLRIESGSVRLSAAESTASTITLRGDWDLQLDLVLEHTQEIPAQDDAAGAESVHARVTLPRRVRIALSSARPAVVEFEPLSAQPYRNQLRLTRTHGVPFLDTISNCLVIPCEASSRAFTFAQGDDRTFHAVGQPVIERSGWALPLTKTTRDALGEADGTGMLWLELRGALRAHWQAHAEPVASKAATLLLAPVSITVFITVLDAEVHQNLQLWDDKHAGTPRRCTIDIASPQGAVIVHVSRPGVESVLIGATARARVDRPVQSDGLRLAANFSIAWLVLRTSEAGTTATVLGLEPTALSVPHISFAIENALLKTRPAVWLYAFGPLVEDRMDAGLLLLRFPLRTLLPTLPDPYAASFDLERTDTDSGWATARVLWPAPTTPIFGFSLQDAPQLAARLSSANVAGARDAESLNLGPVLLDVSSNADQFGIVLPTFARTHINDGTIAIDGLSMVVPAGAAPVITLPPISWEPMLTRIPDPASGDPVLPPPPHDGGIAGFLSEREDLRAATPISLLSAHYAAVRDGKHFAARLPLPFGLIANVSTRQQVPPANTAQFIARGGAVYLNRPVFPGGLTGARQLGVRGAPRPSEIDSPGGFIDASLPGGVAFVDDYAKAVLSSNIRFQFDSEFGSASPAPHIPVRHYELTGYGASLFSDWRNTKAAGPAIIQARFDVFVGRTAHEVIQMQSVLYPWFVRVTRTVQIDRTEGGWVLRVDSGWVAASDGLFAYAPAPADAFSEPSRHLGAIHGVERVRNIRFAGNMFSLPVQGGPTAINWQPVVFDADVIFRTDAAPRLAVAQGSATGRVPSGGITGWIQIGGPQYKDSSGIYLTQPANAKQILDLLSMAGPARAPAGCTLQLGGTSDEPGMIFRATSVDVESNASSSNPQLVVAVRGSPVLPRDGAWSLARKATADPAPNSLDASFPIPLVRPNGAPGTDRWHFADPVDILKLGDAADPATRYGFVQELGAQKVFFARVRVGNDANPISVPQAPLLADMGALLHATTIFPGLADAFDLPSLRALSVKSGDFGFHESFDIVGHETSLVDLGGETAMQVLIRYEDENGKPTRATLKVDPIASPRWSVKLERVCFAVQFKSAKLISLYARVEADEHTAPTVKDLNVHYEGILDALQFIFSNVQQVARFLPGGADAGLMVGFSQGRLAVRNAFALPNLPLGAGQITDVAVEMGFDVVLSPFGFRFVAGLGSSEKPFNWVVSPLAGTGCVQVGVGTAGLDVLVQGGLGLGLAIDLGIASGSAAIALAMEINTGEDPFALRGIISGRASVDVLHGLASATITLAAGLGFVPPPELGESPFVPPQLLPPPKEIPPVTLVLLASVSVGVHVSVCWVADVDWDGYWQFRQQIRTPKIPVPI